MSVQLHYLSEAIFAAMANSKREAFLQTCNLVSETSLDFALSVDELASREATLEPLDGRGFDGASRVDVVVRISRELAVPFELKLGTTRLSASRINEDWLAPCLPSAHQDPRWSGNMMAILDRRFPATVQGDLVAKVGDERLTLTPFWFVVARRQIVDAWKGTRPAFSDRVRIVCFEDVVNGVGGRDDFNRLVRELLDIDFYEQWVGGE